ncbi:MAG: hypothetical protein AB8G77_03695 [Rhodothermales bacterium]
MSYGKSLITVLCFLLIGVENGYSQSSQSALLEVRVQLTSNEADSILVEVEDFDTSTMVHTGSAKLNEPWEANSDDVDQPSADFNFSENTLYKIILTVDGASEEYLYYYCIDGNPPADEEFFCRIDNDSDNNDVVFEYDGGFAVKPSGFGSVDFDLSFTDDNWILPYNLYQHCGTDTPPCNTEFLGIS